MRMLAVIAAASLVVCGHKPALAEDWPTHPLTMVVPWAAGGGTDVMGRIMAKRMAEILGQPVIVENIPGGGGMVGSAHVARSEPDGYTFVFGSRSDAIDMTLYKHPIYSFKDDLTPVVLVADQPTILVAREDLTVNGLRDFVDYLKKNASTVKMGSAGIGATGTVDCVLFNDKIGINVQPIPYRGSGPAMQDLIARQFDYFCTISGSAVSPENTPPEIVKKLHDASVDAMETPEVQKQLANNGTYVFPPDQRSTEYFQSIIVPEIEKNGAPLKAAGVSVD